MRSIAPRTPAPRTGSARSVGARRASEALLLLAALLGAGGANAAPPASDPPAPPRSAARAFCEYVTAVAASEGALLRAPWLFSSFGTLRGAGALDTEAVAAVDRERELTLRFQAGLGFSPTRFHRAGLLSEQAQAECERRHAAEDIRALGAIPGGVTRAALEAKISVLREALPEAERLARRSLDELDASRTTVQEHHALELRVDELRQRLAGATLELASLPEAEEPARAVRDPFERLRRWSAEEQAAASRLRRAEALSLTLRGGYDELLGVPQQLPVFGSISLEVNPGWLWQRGHDARAEQAHADALEVDVQGRRESLAALGRRLLAELGVVRQRLREVRSSLSDLERRRERLEAAGSSAAREYAEYIWFDVVRLRAEEAQLAEQVITLGSLTGSGEEP